MSGGEFADFLAASLDALSREAPHTHRRLAGAMEGHPVAFRADARSFCLRARAGSFSIGRRPPPAALRVGLDKPLVLDLVDGRVSLEDAVWNERLFIRGELDAARRFFQCLHLYLQGAVRSPSFALLLDAYRRGAQPPNHH